MARLAFPRPAGARLCWCGHPRSAHEHWRPGTECALCPEGTCARFRQPRLARIWKG